MSEKNRTTYECKILENVSDGSRHGKASIANMDRNYRDWIQSNKLAWDTANANIPDDAFADNVPDDIDQHGTVSKQVTHVWTDYHLSVPWHRIMK